MTNDPKHVVSIGTLKGNSTYRNNSVSLPKELFHQYPSISKLKIGQRKKKVHFFQNNTQNTVLLTRDILKKCGLYPRIKCNLKVENDTLWFGPLVGVFTSIGYIRYLKEQRPSFRSIELEKANRDAKTVLFYFSIKDISFKKKTISGTSFNVRRGQWERRTYPFPDVLYDRGSGRATQKEKHVIARQQLSQFPISKINAQHYFDKWDLHEKLIQCNEMKPYLPETKLYDFHELEKMLKKHSTIYLKSAIGSMGRRVMRLTKDSHYNFSCFREELQTGTLDKLDDIHSVIEQFFGVDKIIMQQGIDLFKINNRNVDMRATVQRNGSDDLVINSIAVRIGIEGSPVTSSRSGSNVQRLDEFLENYGYHFSSDVKERIEKFLFQTYRCIENVYGPFGEMGIDFGLDNKGNVYFIESNSKPAKDTLYKSHDKNTIRNAFLNPLEYAKYLTKF
ncbi:hypothetical protein JIR001_18990 [Polycladomyces abyssicola]|uniref:Uncharacterized protein n=1 Tax=Polycladomyces abyssicola TaxID=1125966 RepID=A0A8D5UGN8_9BACL|nr:YheC/YheD family protein [Polycladomyces abyssicola]BCU82116.1 hypothetical protein JIR001_18990 [Polycladomyces abyssicola]